MVPGDFNYLVNPAHAGISQVRIVKTEPFGSPLSRDQRERGRGVGGEVLEADQRRETREY